MCSTSQLKFTDKFWSNCTILLGNFALNFIHVVIEKVSVANETPTGC